MKTYAILNDGAAQLHLEPENEWEKNILKQFANTPHPVEVHHGNTFFETAGHYMRGHVKGDGLSLVRGLRKGD